MPSIGGISKSQHASLQIEHEPKTTKAINSSDQDEFEPAKPVWWRRSEIKMPQIVKPLWVQDDYDTPQKQREILNRNGIVAVSSLGGTSWPSFEHLPTVRGYIENLDETRYFLAHLKECGGCERVDSFRNKADWLLEIFARAPQLDRSKSILQATAQSKEAQLECIDTLIHGKVDS